MEIKSLFNSVPKSVFDELPSVIQKFEINTPLRLSHFLGQVAHESELFTHKVENCSYSDVNRIVQIFRHDADLNHDKIIEPEELENAKKYVKNGQALANFVYANQNGNGNEASGDGWNFRGRGYIQLTGRINYAAFDKFVDDNIIANPNLVADKYPLLSAGWFWNSHKLNLTADLGSSGDIVAKVTKVINGGLIGLQERIKLMDGYYKLLIGQTIPQAPKGELKPLPTFPGEGQHTAK